MYVPSRLSATVHATGKSTLLVGLTARSTTVWSFGVASRQTSTMARVESN